MTAERTAELRRGWWGFSGFQATGMIKWGQISKPKKVPRASNKTQKTPWTLNNPKKSHAKFLSFKNLRKGKQVWLYFNRRTMRPRYAGTITNLQIVLNSQKNLYLPSHPKNTCQIFLPQKIPESKISDPKKICQLSLLLEIQCTPPPPFQGCRVFGKKNFTGLLDITSTRNCIIYKKSLH